MSANPGNLSVIDGLCLPSESKIHTLFLTELANCVDRLCCSQPASIVAIDSIPSLIQLESAQRDTRYA